MERIRQALRRWLKLDEDRAVMGMAAMSVRQELLAMEAKIGLQRVATGNPNGEYLLVNNLEYRRLKKQGKIVKDSDDANGAR